MTADACKLCEKLSPALRAAVAGLVMLCGVIPLVIYGMIDAHCATLTPDDAQQLLCRGERPALLVDVRSRGAFLQGHLAGAVNWPLGEVCHVHAPADVPAAYRARTLLLVCDVGLNSRWAAWHLLRCGVVEVHNVRGGIQEWIRSAAVEAETHESSAGRPGTVQELLERSDPPPAGAFDHWQTGTGRVEPLPFRVSPVFEQAVAVLAFFCVKPIYTVLSLLGIIVLWRSRDADLVAARWALLAFFFGENACAVNYFAFRETSYLMEYLHSLGMLACFGFAAYAVLEGIDRRILHLSDPRLPCAALGLCVKCVKHARVPCGLRRVFLCIIPALVVATLMLPTADWQDESYNTFVFGQPYNYAHLHAFQIFENWYCAAAGLAMLAVSLGILLLKGQPGITGAKIALAAALGPLGFGFLRMILAGAYHQNRVWYLCWEEVTELLFVLTIGCVLWIFRRRLLPEWGQEPAAVGTDE